MAKKAEEETKYVCRLPMGYGPETQIDRGQIFELTGQPNDVRLIKFGYVHEFEGSETYECAECGKSFASMGARTGHGRLRHPGRDLSPQEEEQLQDRVQEELDRELKAGTLLNLSPA